MIGIKVSLDRRRALQNGSYRIVYRISHNRKSTSLSTGFSCMEGDWDDSKETLISSKGESKIIAQGIQERKVSLMQRAIEYERKYTDGGSLNSIKQFLLGKSVVNYTLGQFWVAEIKRLQESKFYGNARNYKSALGAIKGVVSVDIPFSHVDYSWLSNLETLLRKKGVSTNAIAVYLRHLRSIVNRAIDHEITDGGNYAFKRYKIKTEPTTPRPISAKDLRNLFLFQSDHKKQQTARDYGVLMFMLRGINFADLATLTESNIRNGRIIYNRRKTGKQYSILITDEIRKLLDKYRSTDRLALLPILTDQELKNEEKLIEVIMQKRKTLNKWLRKIGVNSGSRIALTTYVFRYTHANICKQLGYSKDLISESLGHAYGLAVSSNYLESYDVELIDEMNQRVCTSIIDGE